MTLDRLAAPRLNRGKWAPAPRRYVGVLLVAPMLVVLVGLVFVPLIKLIGIALPEGIDYSGIRDYFSNAARSRALVITFRDSLFVTLLAIGFGYVLAWTLRTSRSRLLQGLVWVAVFLPFLMGTVVKNYAFVLLLARRGILNAVLLKLGVIAAPLPLLYNEIAVVIGILYTMLPYAVIPLYVTLLTIDLDMVAAAQSLGAGRARAIFSVVLPLSLSSATAVGVLIFVISLGFYVTPVVLGGATSPFVATLIQNDMIQFFDIKSAAISALLLVLLAGLAVLIAVATMGSERLRKAMG